MSRLIALIDDWRDRNGQPSEASVARAIGVAPQTVNSWRTRGIKQLPDTETLRELARHISQDYESVVLRAALLDIGWLEESDGDGNAAPTNVTDVSDLLPKVVGEELKVAKKPPKKKG